MLGGCAALGLSVEAVAAGAVDHDDNPRAWLARTDAALSNRNYEGVFVHEHAGESETLRVIHRVDSDGVAERLLSMDGSGREFIRRGTQLICYLPDQRTVLVEKSPDSALLLSGLPLLDAGTAGQYEVKEVARARVSGRDTRVIAIAPLDQLRYGYRIWIDESTAMPLKTQLRDSRGGVLEQIVFTSLNMMVRIPDAELQSGIDARAYRWVRRDAERADAGNQSGSWQASALPPGFRMTASARQMLPAGPVEHLVFSDGLASVSVFIEIVRVRASQPAKDDAATLGTSSAFSTVVQGYRVTAVGEVPPETVRVIAQSIRSAEAANPDTDPPQSVSAAASPVQPDRPFPWPGAAVESGGAASAILGAPSFGNAAAASGSRTLGAERPAFGSTGGVVGFGPGGAAPPAGSGKR